MADYSDPREINRESSYMGRSVDPMAVRRSMTRNSHYSHASVSASTRSWVYSTQQNPPPPPVEPRSAPSPARTPRPLPNQPVLTQPQEFYTTNEIDPADEEEFMSIDANAPGLDTGYQTEGLGRGRAPRVLATPQVLPRGEASGSGGRSFVGGFVSGLRRLPKVVFRTGDKRKFMRRGTFGTEGTVTSITGMTTGNTLPRYVSNPSTPTAGPSNIQYVQSVEMPVPREVETLPPGGIGISGSERRRHPSFRITPPSEVTEPEEAQQYPFPQPEPPHFNEVVSDSPRVDGDRTTVMVYNDPPHEMATGVTGPAPTPNRRASTHNPPITQDENPSSPQPRSPVVVHPLPAEDYRRMTLSTSPTSPGTITSTLMTSEPSFSSELNPVKRFFHTLYTMPWIAHDRVTVDYRPGRGGGGARGGISKKLMASWYRGKPGVVMSSRTGSADIDLLSGGNPSRRASGATGSTPVASPPSGRARRHATGNHRREHRHRRRERERGHDERHSSRRRDTRSTTTEAVMRHQRSMSPMIPAVYPYPYPYSYGYPTFPSPTVHHRESRVHSNSHSTPRGPRSHRAPYPHAFPPYQPPPPAPPVYVFQQSHAPSNGSGEPAQGQVVTPVFMPMQLVPGSFSPESFGNPPSPPPAAAPTAVRPS